MTSSTPAVPGPLTLLPFSEGVMRVRSADGLPVGNFKRIGAVWKFKAVGVDASGALEPGGGPLTLAHNTVCEKPDAALLSVPMGSG